MHLAKISHNDAPLLVRWRNENAGYFPPAPGLTIESHLTWYWGTYQLDPADHMYIVNDIKPVGAISVNVSTREIGRVMRGEPDSPGAMGWALGRIMKVYSPHDRYDFWLKVLKGNDHAIAFYRKHGFTSGASRGEFEIMYCTRRQG